MKSVWILPHNSKEFDKVLPFLIDFSKEHIPRAMIDDEDSCFAFLMNVKNQIETNHSKDVIKKSST